MNKSERKKKGKYFLNLQASNIYLLDWIGFKCWLLLIGTPGPKLIFFIANA